jgi:hypothetical protein
MNIEFADRLSQVAWCYLSSHPDHAESFQDFILTKFTGGWHTVAPDVSPDPDHPDRPDWSHQRGAIITLKIAANTHGDAFYWSPDEGEIPCTREFRWGIFAHPVDRYGLLDPAAQAKRIINGGFINHGSHAEPRWSSHT